MEEDEKAINSLLCERGKKGNKKEGYSKSPWIVI